MNLMVVSEKHGLVIIAVDHELHVYQIDPVTLKLSNTKKFKTITLGSQQVTLTTYSIHIARNQQS